MPLNIYYYLDHKSHEEFPGNDNVIEGTEGMACINGIIIGKDSDGFELLLKQGSRSKQVKVLSDSVVDAGDVVEILGVLTHEEVVPLKMLIQKSWSYRFIFIRSMFAIPILAYLFLKLWTFDFIKMGVRKKDA
jgi:hypothetical protein